MTLITSISGIRGTIGGKPGEALTPDDIARFTVAYARMVKERTGKLKPRVVIGRDARLSGPMVSKLVSGVLMSCGIDVIDTGLSTTPTVEMAVVKTSSDGGIILTASHNPGHWNALKLLNGDGEFLSAADGNRLMELVSSHSDHAYEPIGSLGEYSFDENQLREHIQCILALDLVDTDAISKAGLRVAFDSVNSVGGLALPELLTALGVNDILPLNARADGLFAHNPEPLPEHLEGIFQLVKDRKADVGFVVDPDVDRLAIVSEDGSYFGEEYTLVAVSDYVLRHTPGNTVSNLSSTRALRDITEKHGMQYSASAVGEVNVVEEMKRTAAVIGGEGNGGVIYPELHYGRDALVGIALFLSHLVRSGLSCSELRKSYPDYYMVKRKADLHPGTNLDNVLSALAEDYREFPVNRTDGVRIDFPEGWVHLRRSNTEPVIRIYAESREERSALLLAEKIIVQLSR